VSKFLRGIYFINNIYLFGANCPLLSSADLFKFRKF